MRLAKKTAEFNALDVRAYRFILKEDPMKRILAVAFLLSIPAHVSARDTTCKVSMSQYLQLRDGMSYADAVRVLGCPGIEMSRSSFMDMTMVIYIWSGNSFVANMNATFQNDAMIARAQMGLK